MKVRLDETLFKARAQENLSMTNDTNKLEQVDALVECLDHFVADRKWVDEISRDELLTMVTQSNGDKEVLIESVLAKFNTPCIDTKKLKECKERRQNNRVTESMKKRKSLKESDNRDTFTLDTSNTPILNCGLYYTLLGELDPGRYDERFKEFEECVKECAKPILDELVRETPNFEVVSVGNYYHPRYYNYETDSLEFTVKYTGNDLGTVIEEYSNNQDFIDFLQNYKSYDRFSSFYADNKDDFIKQDYVKSVSQIIKYNVTEEEYDEANEDLYYDVMDCGFYPEDDTDESLKEKKYDIYVNDKYVASSDRHKRAKDVEDKIRKDGKIKYAGEKALRTAGVELDELNVGAKDKLKVKRARESKENKNLFAYRIYMRDKDKDFASGKDYKDVESMLKDAKKDFELANNELRTNPKYLVCMLFDWVYDEYYHYKNLYSVKEIEDEIKLERKEKKYSWEYRPNTSILSKPSNSQKTIIRDAEDGPLRKFYDYDEGGNYFTFNTRDFEEHKKDIAMWIKKYPKFDIVKGTFKALYGEGDYDDYVIKYPNDKYIYLLTDYNPFENLETKPYTYEPKDDEVIFVDMNLDESKKLKEGTSTSDWDLMRKARNFTQDEVLKALKGVVSTKAYNDIKNDYKIAKLRYLTKSEQEKVAKKLDKKDVKESLKEGYYGQTLQDFLDDCTDYSVIDKIYIYGNDDVVYEGPIDDIPEDMLETEFLECDMYTNRKSVVTVNVDSSEEYGAGTYEFLNEFLDDCNCELVVIYDLAKGEEIFSGYKDDIPEEYLEYAFDSYDAPEEMSVNLNDYEGEDEFNESLKEDDDKEVEKLDTFDDQMDFLAKDEQEAIDGYKKVINKVSNAKVKAQLKKIETEEKAHKDYLNKVKKNKDLEYTEPLIERKGNKCCKGKCKKANESLEQYHYARVLKKLAGRTITEHDLDACAKEIGMNGYRLWNVLKALVDDMYIVNGENHGEEYFKIPTNAYDELPSELKENLKEDVSKSEFSDLLFDTILKNDKFKQLDVDKFNDDVDKPNEVDNKNGIIRLNYDNKYFEIKVNEIGENLKEDTVKKGNKWVNKGNTGKTHGEFKTKKQADAQRKAMFVNKNKNSNWGK